VYPKRKTDTSPATQEPVLVRTDPVLGKMYEHPAWGMASFCRVQGLATLFGSAIDHRHYIVFRVGRAHKSVSDAGEEQIFGNNIRGELVEIAMSEAQFGQLIGSMNTSGAPCTIEHVGGVRQPPCPPDETKENFHRAIEADAATATAELQALRDELKARFADSKPIGKAERQSIVASVESVTRLIEDRLPFIQRMLHEKVEEQVAAAKVDIQNFVRHKMETLGFQTALGANPALPDVAQMALPEGPK
jgi:hypothetical protein